MLKRELKVNLNATFLNQYYTKQIKQFCITYTWPKNGDIGEILHFYIIFICVKAMVNYKLNFV